MTTLVRGLYATDMMAVNSPRSVASDACTCTCSHDVAPSTVNSLDASPVLSAFDAGMKPYEAMKEITTAGLKHFGVAADSGKMTGHNDRMKKLWGR